MSDATADLTGEGGRSVDDVEVVVHDVAPFDSARFVAMYPQLRRLAGAVAPPGTEADDLVHEAVARMLARTRRAGPVRDPQSYLARSIINLARSRRRRWARRRQIPTPRLTSSHDPEPDELGVLLDQLHPRQRACLWLRFVEDRSVAETAVVLGCSEGTVKSQTSKALATLRRSAQLRSIASPEPPAPDPKAGMP